MSGWSAYITRLTDQSSSITRAAIIGLDGSVWARTEGNNVFKATEEELKKLVAGFEDSNVLSVGVDFDNVHYVVTRKTEDLIFGKKGKTGFVAVKTKQAIIISLIEGEGLADTDARDAVVRLGNYLVSTGF